VGDESASAVLDGDAGHRLLTEHLPGLGVVGFDHHLAIRIATGTAVWAEGFAPAELVGRRLPELARHGDAETLRVDPSPVSAEHRIVRPDGTVRTILGRGEGVVDETGQVVRVVGVNQDITERRRADEERLLGRLYELQESQDRRLAADLHDGHIQSLAAIDFKLE
jgi:PAS domain S-box-containing protein